jgi:ribosomal protein eS8
MTRRSASGAQRAHFRKKRKFELGRQPAMTKLGVKRIHTVRVRGGNLKHRALRLESGNFAWGSEHCTRKTRIIGVVYNSTNNELVRTNTLVKNSIIQVDAAPFRQWYEAHYGSPVSKKGKQVGQNDYTACVSEQGAESIYANSVTVRGKGGDQAIQPHQTHPRGAQKDSKDRPSPRVAILRWSTIRMHRFPPRSIWQS